MDGTVVPEGRETLVVGLEVREDVLEGRYGKDLHKSKSSAMMFVFVISRDIFIVNWLRKSQFKRIISDDLNQY